MLRNRGGGGQGLLGNAPVGFGNQSGAFSNNQSSAFSSKGFGNNVQSFGNNNGTGGSGGGSQNRFADHHNDGNAHHSDFSGQIKNQRTDFFGGGNNMGSSGKFHNNGNSFNGSFSSSTFDNGSNRSGSYSNNSSNHNQPLQQQRSNMQGVGALPQLQQLQQRQQQQANRATIGFGAGNNGQSLNTPQQQMNQLFNTDRDSQLALVNSLLKGSLIPNNNAMNLQQQQQQNQKMQSLQSPIDNMQGMGSTKSMGMSQQGMNQQRMNGNGMNGSGMNMGMSGIQGGGNHGNGGNGVTMSNHLGQGQFGAMGANSGGTGNMGMTSPGGGHSILGMPKGHQGLIANSQGGHLGNSQGLLGNQHSLLGNPSLPRNPDFMHRNSGGLLGRSNNNNNNRVNNGPRGGNHGYNPNNRPNNRSIQQHNRGRPERRGNNSNDQHRRHDSRDSRDSHDSRDGRSRHGHDRRESNKRDESRNECSEKRQVALPPSGGCESLRVSVGDGQEEYDPAEPTEDNAESNATSESALLIEADRDRDLGSPEVTVIYHGGQKRPRSHSPVSRPHTTSGDLKVTVDAQGRSVQDGPPQPKTRRESSGSDIKDGDDQKFTCYACSVDCKDIQHFESHMRSARHRTRMESICNLHVQKTDQQLARMRAEEHLRRIEGREKEDYCRICDKRFVGSFITHRRGQEHRRKERLTKRGCKLCRTGSFVQYCEYVKHIDSEPHKKNKEVLRKQEQTSSHGRDDDDDDIESFPDSFEELVTLDATGIYKNDENDEVISDNDNDSITEEGFSTATTTNKDQENIKLASVKNMSSMQTPIMPKSEQSEAEDDEENAKPVVVKVEKDGSPAADKMPAADRLCSQEEEPRQQTVLSLPEFDSKVAVGQDHVVPMKGFFCKLCKKFFMSENAARTQHCRTQTHFDMYITYQKALHIKKAELENSYDGQQINPCQNSNIEDGTPVPDEDDTPTPDEVVEASECSVLNNGNDMGLDDDHDTDNFQDASEPNENDTQEDHEVDEQEEQEEVTENSEESSLTVINGDILTIQPVVNGNEKSILENDNEQEQENGIDEDQEIEPSPTAAKKALKVRRGRSRRGRAK